MRFIPYEWHRASTYTYALRLFRVHVVLKPLSHFPSPSRIHSINMTSQWPLTKFEAQMNKTNSIQRGMLDAKS